MEDLSLMNDFFATVSYAGDVRPYLELPEIATSEDEPDDGDPRTLGDKPGHDFHGNQWTDNAWRADPYARVPDTLYRGSVNKPFDEVLRGTHGGELGGGIYFTADYHLARTYGGGPDASFEGGTRAVHEAEWVRKPEPHEVAYMEGLDKDHHMSRLVDGNGKELWRGAWPGFKDPAANHFTARDAMFQAAKDHDIKVMIGLRSSFATNQISVLDKSLLKLKQTLALPYHDVPHYEPPDVQTSRFYPKYRVKSTAPVDQPRSPTSRHLGDNPGHEFHGNQWTEGDGSAGSAGYGAVGVQLYLESSSRINDALRHGTETTLDADERHAIAQMDAAMQPSERSARLYRAVPPSVYDKLVDGSTFTDAAFISASRDSAIEKTLLDDAGLVHERLKTVVIDAPRGTLSYDVNERLGRRAEYPKQQEVVLARGTSFTVVRGMTNGRSFIRLMVQPR